MSHPEPTSEPFVFISAAEQSADNYGAALVHAARQLDPGIRFVGVAGPRMIDAGCTSVYDFTSHSAMLLEAARLAGRAWTMLRTSHRLLADPNCLAAVLIDSPVLHLRLAARAKRLGVPVLYYIAPQLWAWGGWRINRLRRSVDRLAVIFPFEESFFQSRGVRATFVGHPLADKLAAEQVPDDEFRRLRGTGSPFVVLLPGSRRHVVEEVLPGQLEVAARIGEAFPDAAFGVSVANDGVETVISMQIESSSCPMTRVCGLPAPLIRAADLVLVASGTSALEAAMHAKPMIVMYNASRLSYQLLGRWLLRTPHLSLPNILAGRRIVPEFMPYYRSTKPIVAAALELLRDGNRRANMVRELEDVTKPLRAVCASRNVATILCEMIQARRQGV